MSITQVEAPPARADMCVVFFRLTLLILGAPGVVSLTRSLGTGFFVFFVPPSTTSPVCHLTVDCAGCVSVTDCVKVRTLLISRRVEEVSPWILALGALAFPFGTVGDVPAVWSMRSPVVPLVGRSSGSLICLIPRKVTQVKGPGTIFKL